jgi:hypothetical protein
MLVVKLSHWWWRLKCAFEVERESERSSGAVDQVPIRRRLPCDGVLSGS